MSEVYSLWRMHTDPRNAHVNANAKRQRLQAGKYLWKSLFSLYLDVDRSDVPGALKVGIPVCACNV